MTLFTGHFSYLRKSKERLLILIRRAKTAEFRKQSEGKTLKKYTCFYSDLKCNPNPYTGIINLLEKTFINLASLSTVKPRQAKV